MSSLNKLKDILRQQEQLHRYPINYTIPELWDCDHIAVQSGGLPVGNGEIIVNPYRFFADLIDHWLKDRDASDAATPYYRHHTLPKELRKGNWIRQSFIYSCMIRSSGSWDHDRSGKLEEADLYGLQENGTFVKTLALLPLLKKMGIDTLYLLPVMKYSRKNKKGELGSPYSVKNFFELDSSLKDPMTCDQMSVDEEFQALVEACHLLDIKVIIDIIPRTNAIDSDLIAEHPDWFYWIESNELEGYRPPLVPGVEPGVSAQQQYLEKIYASREVLQHIRKFRPSPQQRDPEKWKALIRSWKRGKQDLSDLIRQRFGITVAPAFSDCINDPQPAWSDITFFRMYLDHPAASQPYLPENEEIAPYILYDVAKSSLNPGNVPNQPLWDMLESIIPFYQEKFGIDGARIDMGHALPLPLVHNIISRAREVDPDFCFIAEELSKDNAQISVEKGYNMIAGNGFTELTRPREDRLNAFAYGALNLPCPMFAAGETHDTPRLSAREGGRTFCRMITLLDLFLPHCVPFLNSGQEVYEKQPMNTGLDCRADEHLQLDPSDPFYRKLALFDRYAFHLTDPDRWQLPLLLEKASAIRRKYRSAMLNDNSIIPLMFEGPWIPAVGFGYALRRSMILVIANHDLNAPQDHLIQLWNLPQRFLDHDTQARLIFSSEQAESYLHFDNHTLTTRFLPGEVKIFEIRL